MNQIKIGEFLKELRKEKGLTQEQLAEQFNVSRRSVSRRETGNSVKVSTGPAQRKKGAQKRPCKQPFFLQG